MQVGQCRLLKIRRGTRHKAAGGAHGTEQIMNLKVIIWWLVSVAVELAPLWSGSQSSKKVLKIKTLL